MQNNNQILILENIRSAQNVGSLFRTADAAGMGKIYLIGQTPTPIDRFHRVQPDIVKTALGAEKTIPWQYVKTITPLLKKLKKEKFTIIAIEQDTKSVDYKKIKVTNKTAFILGNEVSGISKSALLHSGTIAEIPMRGRKESLNVSVAGGIALFRMLGL